MKNKILSISLVIFAVMIIAAAALFLFGGNTEKNSEEVTVFVTVINGNQSQEYTVTTKSSNLGDALTEKDLIKGENGEYGLYITEVAGTRADADKEQWWCITKGGESVMTGISQVEIADGDKYELTLKEGY